jgi:hypothetical protein
MEVFFDIPAGHADVLVFLFVINAGNVSSVKVFIQDFFALFHVVRFKVTLQLDV